MQHITSDLTSSTQSSLRLATSAGNALPPTRTFVDCILGGLFSDNPDPEKLDSCQKVNQFFRTVWNSRLINEQEQVYVAFVDRGLNLIDWKCLFTGTASEVLLDVNIISRKALESKAHGVFLAHNHPSNEKSPSELDIKVTDILNRALKMFNIELIDHLILTPKSYYSFSQESKL